MCSAWGLDRTWRFRNLGNGSPGPILFVIAVSDNGCNPDSEPIPTSNSHDSLPREFGSARMPTLAHLAVLRGYHIMGVKHGDKLTLHLDGRARTSAKVPRAIRSSASNFAIGGSPNFSGAPQVPRGESGRPPLLRASPFGRGGKATVRCRLRSRLICFQIAYFKSLLFLLPPPSSNAMKSEPRYT